MYRDIQEPMMNAATRPNQYQVIIIKIIEEYSFKICMINLKFQSNNSDNAGNTSNQAGRQNTEALPNPWGAANPSSQANTVSIYRAKLVFEIVWKKSDNFW